MERVVYKLESLIRGVFEGILIWVKKKSEFLILGFNGGQGTEGFEAKDVVEIRLGGIKDSESGEHLGEAGERSAEFVGTSRVL